MKLAFCLFNYFPYGGLERDFFRIASAFTARGHEIHVFTMSFSGEVPRGWNVHIVPVSGILNHQRIASFIARTQKKLANALFDKVIGFNKMPGLDWYYVADTAWCAREKASWLRVLPRYRAYAAWEASVFLEKRTRLLFLTEQTRDQYLEYYQFARERAYLLPPGIDPRYQHLPQKETVSQSMRSTCALPKDKIILLMVASSFRTKGLDRALRAIASLSANLQEQLAFCIVGGDNPMPYRRLAKSLSLQVPLYFASAQNDVMPWMQAADLLLHPAYHENSGTVLLEALLVGLPVVTSAVCGYAPYIQRASAGVVMKGPFDQKAFNETLSHLLQNASLLKTFSQNACQFAKQNNFYQLVEEVVHLIETHEESVC